MTVTNKKKTAVTLISVSAFILAFALYYLSGFIFESAALYYIHFFFKDALDAIFPIIALSLILPSFINRGYKGSLLSALVYSCVTLIYTFPAYIFEYAYAGYEIGDVLILSLLFSLLSYVTVYATIALLLILTVFVTKFCVKKKGKSNVNVKLALDKRFDLFDFSEPVSIGLIASSFAVFIYKLALEIYDTVLFLVNYSGTYTFGEIIYLLIRYIFILVVFICSYLASYKIKDVLSKKTTP